MSKNMSQRLLRLRKELMYAASAPNPDQARIDSLIASIKLEKEAQNSRQESQKRAVVLSALVVLLALVGLALTSSLNSRITGFAVISQLEPGYIAINQQISQRSYYESEVNLSRSIGVALEVFSDKGTNITAELYIKNNSNDISKDVNNNSKYTIYSGEIAGSAGSSKTNVLCNDTCLHALPPGTYVLKITAKDNTVFVKGLKLTKPGIKEFDVEPESIFVSYNGEAETAKITVTNPRKESFKVLIRVEEAVEGTEEATLEFSNNELEKEVYVTVSKPAEPKPAVQANTTKIADIVFSFDESSNVSSQNAIEKVSVFATKDVKGRPAERLSPAQETKANMLTLILTCIALALLVALAIAVKNMTKVKDSKK